MRTIGTGKAVSSNYIEYEGNRDKDKILSIKEYLDEIKRYLNDLIDLKSKGEWNIKLIMSINCFPLNILVKYVLCIQSLMA